MADALRVAVVPRVDGRLGVISIDPSTLEMSGPDVGDDRRGYTADELHPVLSERYGMSAPEIEELISVSLNSDIEERLAFVLAKAAGG